ncbi:MAG: RHS repeat-associated core domain-containing protein [Chryseobacterium sp.]|nr:RHS repeat-associated core domain-containing protein [Chryseobacterium sp.]
MPVVVASANGAYHSSLDSTSANSYYGIGNAFSEVQLERSPLGRVYKAASPGADWALGTGHTVKYDYATNSGNEVKHIVASATWNPTTKINDITLSLAADDDYNFSGFYRAQTLSKKIVKDEDDQEMIVYANSAGQNLMERKVNIKSDDTPEYLDTYYVYDDFGNMVLVIPPKAAVFTNIAQLTSFLAPLCYQYRYDRYHRLAEKRLPGRGDWESIVYDKQHRVVLVQDAAQKGRQWTFTKYDRYGRTVYTGLFANTASRIAMQTALNNMSANALNNEERATSPFTQNGLAVYYTKQAFPTGSMTLMSVNYYDDYPTGSVPRPDNIQNVPTLGSTPTAMSLNGKTTSRSTKGMTTASLVKNTDTDAWTKSYVWYDTQGRGIGSHTINHLGGRTSTESVLDFSGAVTTSYTYHKRLSGSTEVTIKQSFSYDDQKRLLVHKHQVNGGTEEILTRNEYNELGQLKTKKVGGTDIATPLEVMKYDYNIRGWMTGINLNDDATATHNTSRLFSYKINYNNALEGLAHPNTEVQKPVARRYNGSIAEVSWRSGNSTQVKRYGYVYDRVNRMVAGLYQNPTNASSKEHSEMVAYDLNGNISRLMRSSYQVGTSASLIDDLYYSYGGNQLTSVLDDTDDSNGYGPGGNPIGYDANGNMTDMLDRSINSITYNYLNLPVKMSVWMRNGGADITNTYRADGAKLRKQHVMTIAGMNSSTTTTDITDYLDGFHYLIHQSATIERKSSEGDIEEEEPELAVAMEREAYMNVAKAALPVDGGPVLAENAVLQYIPTAEGFYDFAENKYIYQYKDHVGNVRVSFAKNSAGVPEIIETNDYYAFGMNHLGADNLSGFGQGAYQNYKYNGKELQETGFLDYGWRQYMPDLGRWFGMDQLSEAYLSTSPYAYVMNNPVMYNDVDGRLHEFKMAEENEGLEWSKGLNNMLTTGSGASTDAWNSLSNWGNSGYGDLINPDDIAYVGQGSIASFLAYMSVGGSVSSYVNYANGKGGLYNFYKDEEPVNFFGKNDGYSFNKKFELNHDKFKNTEGDGIFRAYGHGWMGYMWDGDKKIEDAATFDKAMGSKNSRWASIDKMKDPILILYICYSGTDTNKNKSIASKISAAHPNLTVIGFRNEIIYNTPGTRLTKTLRNGTDGDIIFFRNGEAIKGYQYNKFLEKYKNFQ